MKIPFLAFLVTLVISSCSSNKQETTTQESTTVPDSVTTPAVKVVSDTITSYVDLKAIEVTGNSDSIKLSFGPEGKLIMRKKILGPMSEQAVGRGFAGVDELAAMPKGYEPTAMPFSYSGTPFRDLLGNRYRLKYQLIDAMPTFYEIEESGDVQSLAGEWKFVQEVDGKYAFVNDGSYEPTRLLFKPAEKKLLILDVDTTVYNITQITFTEYGKRGTLILSGENAQGDRPNMTVTFYELTDEYNNYLMTTWTSLFKDGAEANFVREKYYSKYKKR